MDWKKLCNELLIYDPNLQLKEDGIEMFDAELVVLSNNDDDTEVELIWEENRQQWSKTIHKAVSDHMAPPAATAKA